MVVAHRNWSKRMLENETVATKHRLAPLCGLIGGLTIAALLGQLIESSSPSVHFLQQAIIVGFFATGLTVAQSRSTWSIDLAAAMRALALVVSAQFALTLATLVWIDTPFSRYSGVIVDAMFRSFGWYPHGADAWLPLALGIWLLSTALLAVLSVGVAIVMRTLKRAD